MFEGLRSLIYQIPPEKLQEAKEWYTKLLGQKPYFDEPFYIGFNIGGFELGLHPNSGPLVQGNNIHTYLGVKDIEEAFQHSLNLNATSEIPIEDVGGDIRTATVRDPFGNLLGFIQNPHFKIS